MNDNLIINRLNIVNRIINRKKIFIIKHYSFFIYFQKLIESFQLIVSHIIQHFTQIVKYTYIYIFSLFNNSFLTFSAMPSPLHFRISRAHDATCMRINKRNRALSQRFDWIARDRNRRGGLRRKKLLTAGYIEVKPTSSCACTRRFDIQRPNFERQCNETRALIAWPVRPIFFVFAFPSHI